MQRGQISIDLLFTLIAVLLIAITFGGLINSTYLTHDRLNTKLQLDMENDKITNFITQTQMIDDYTYSIRTSLKKITYLDSNKNQVKQYPTISVEGDLLKLSINTGEENIESIRRFSKNIDTIVIFGTDQENGSVVIQHE